LQLTKQSLKHQQSSDPGRSYPYRASGLVHGSIADDLPRDRSGWKARDE